ARYRPVDPRSRRAAIHGLRVQRGGGVRGDGGTPLSQRARPISRCDAGSSPHLPHRALPDEIRATRACADRDLARESALSQLPLVAAAAALAALRTRASVAKRGGATTSSVADRPVHGPRSLPLPLRERTPLRAGRIRPSGGPW